MPKEAMLSAYTDGGAMRFSRPPTPQGVALYGNCMRCPSCDDPRALAGHKGKVEVCLCPKCGHGYPEEKKARLAVVRIAAPAVEKQEEVEVTTMEQNQETVQQHAARKYKEARERLKLSHAQMAEEMNKCPHIDRELKHPSVSVSMSPAGLKSCSEAFASEILQAVEFVDAPTAPPAKDDGEGVVEIVGSDVQQLIIDRFGASLEEMDAIAADIKLLLVTRRHGYTPSIMIPAGGSSR